MRETERAGAIGSCLRSWFVAQPPWFWSFFFPCVGVCVSALSVLVRLTFGECAQEESRAPRALLSRLPHLCMPSVIFVRL